MSNPTANQGDNRKGEVVLEVKGVTKRFPGVLANADVNLSLHKGEILALLGENGAGKSTLMNIIYGLYHPDEGSIQLRGKPVKFASPREAIHSGIGMVHQHFQLIPVMTVAENVILGEEGTIQPQERDIAPDQSTFAGWIRLLWGGLWRLLIPVLAVLLGVFIGYVLFLLALTIGTYLPQGEAFTRSSYLRLELFARAQTGLGAYYPENQTVVTLLVWAPLVLGAVVGALVLVSGYLHARRTWHGRAANLDYTAHRSSLDAPVNAILDFLGTLRAVISRARAAERVRHISRQFNLEVEPEVFIEKLSVGQQQRVEIVKALYRKADILILDEPTAVLTPQEGRELFRIMRELAAKGVSIIFITHKLKEVFAVADSIVVMRGGRVVGDTTPSQSTEASLAAMMVGRSVMLKVDKTPATPGEVVLKVDDLIATDDRHSVVVDGVSFEVYSGEILGIAGVQGNGQTELVESLTGLRKPVSGSFAVRGEALPFNNPRTVTLSDTAHIPEDRHRYGMVRTFPVAENLVLNSYFRNPFAVFPTLKEFPGWTVFYLIVLGALIFLMYAGLWQPIYNQLASTWSLAELSPRRDPAPFFAALGLSLLVSMVLVYISHRLTILLMGVARRLLPAGSEVQGGLTVNAEAVRQNAYQLIEQFDIRTPSAGVNGGSLSGGNQQKMVVAREFSRSPRLLIAAQPTRGIDVGSIEFIHKQIVGLRDSGAGVLLVSAELDEIMSLSDRIAVMYKGKIIDIVPGGSATREQLGLLMAGIHGQEKASASNT
ncbi:MAG: ABC transporter ATP-binding protein [Anaerolinea sp.]|nr:ABC transporter ATP-binding protein [Anaerolinea sp.]